jgi:hypothetical protein
VFAPQPVSAQPGLAPKNSVISVNVDEDEEVEWTWTSLLNGQRYVSGYTIIKKN